MKYKIIWYFNFYSFFHLAQIEILIKALFFETIEKQIKCGILYTLNIHEYNLSPQYYIYKTFLKYASNVYEVRKETKSYGVEN